MEMRPTDTTGISMLRHFDEPTRFKLDETDQKENKRTQNYDKLPSVHYEIETGKATSETGRARSKSTGKKDSRDQTNPSGNISPVKHS